MQVHAFEPLNVNHDWLSWAFGNQLPPSAHDGTHLMHPDWNETAQSYPRNSVLSFHGPYKTRSFATRFGGVHLSRAALGEKAGLAFMRRDADGRGSGYEVAKPTSVRLDNESWSNPQHNRIQAIVLDDYLPVHGVAHVHLASFDTEGWDALVLRGLARHLTARALDVLEFEWYGDKAVQGGHKLKGMLTWLASLGYACFWLGDAGCLAPIGPFCMTPSVATERAPFGNLVCGANGAGGVTSPAHVLAQLANECLDNFEAVQRRVEDGGFSVDHAEPRQAGEACDAKMAA